MGRFKTIDDVWMYLDAIPMFGKVGASAGNFDLTAIRNFCNKMGDPQDSFPSIHIAGTNGKGTTAWLLEAVYQQAGYRTGMFTSPHLLRYNERFRVAGNEVEDEQLLEFFQQHDKLLQQIKLTYFEISTVLAFWLFSQHKVDIAIVEAGLGGRLDSTNIITPLVAVITSIGLDHQDILGQSLSEIAMEKAGIIKRNIPVVSGQLPPSAERVISARSGVEQSRVYRASDLKPDFQGGLIHFKKTGQSYQTTFRESVNKWNLAMVKQVAELLNNRFPVDELSFKTAVSEFNGVPGRFERLHPDHNWYFSGAHNADALRSVIETSKAFAKQPVFILSFMKDKLTTEVATLFGHVNDLRFYSLEGQRAADETFVKERLRAEFLNASDIISELNELKTSLVIFTGSFYFYNIVKRWISTV